MAVRTASLFTPISVNLLSGNDKIDRTMITILSKYAIQWQYNQSIVPTFLKLCDLDFTIKSIISLNQSK